jgi:LPXTG-motif cell wall-anchored protein
VRKFLPLVLVIAGSVVAAPPAHAGVDPIDPNEFTLSQYGSWCAASTQVPDPPLPDGTSLFAALNAGPASAGSLTVTSLVVSGNEGLFTMEIELSNLDSSTVSASILPSVDYWAVANCDVIPFGGRTLAPPLSENCPVVSIVNDDTTAALQSSVVAFELQTDGDPATTSSWVFPIALPDNLTLTDASITVSVDTCLGADDGGSGGRTPIDWRSRLEESQDQLPNTGSDAQLALVAAVLMVIGGLTRIVTRRVRA